ncbi:hypothetical protein ALC60_02490 [Trachymyrmex zeteki]|nr:hypothetical protein ALC60_02490 [Trachymyrmex zeteki]
MYNTAEYTDIIICYGMADKNGDLAARIYVERFPNREQFPLPKTIKKCVIRAKETGSFQKDKRNCGRALARRVDHEEEILRMFEKNSTTSVRRAASAFDLPR